MGYILTFLPAIRSNVSNLATMDLKYILLLCSSVILVKAGLELTNIKCEPLDKEFVKFEYCYLKSFNRTFKYMSLKANLYQIPVTKVKISIALLKRFSSYRPFLYNITFDGCKLLSNYNDRHPVAKFFYSIFQKYSNFNHSCPYDHDLILDKLPTGFLYTNVIDVLPFPEGDYAFYTRWFVYGRTRADVNVYFKIG